MTNRFTYLLAAVGLGFWPYTALAQSVDRTVLVNRYCTSCHNEKRPVAGLALSNLDAGVLKGHEEIWEKVVRKVRSGEMPPAGLPAPDKSLRSAFVASLEASLDKEAAAHPNPGRSVAHRLNRTEYSNAVRDLLGIEINARELLPADDSGYGFDNIAEILSLTPALLDRYMSAAGKVSRLAVGDPEAVRPSVRTYSVRRELLQDGRMSEDLPFGSRGGFSVNHYFPVDGEYLIKLRLMRTAKGAIIGIDRPNTLELQLDRSRLKTFTVGGNGPINPWAAVANPSLYQQTADDGLEVRLNVKAGTREVGAAFLTSSGIPENPMLPRLSPSSYEYAMDDDAEMSLEIIEISGPFHIEGTHHNPRIFVCDPEAKAGEDVCARQILSTLARRAFRRPVTSQDTGMLMDFYKMGRAAGTFEAGIELALREILVDPDFLFRIERDPANVARGTVYRVNDLELASRLSFFLWSSIPDDELLDLAVANRLHDPAVLEKQVRRMIADSRSSAIITNFAGQWLYVRNIQGVAPDPGSFPDFDENLREAFYKETQLFMESQLRENRSVTELLTANYTFVNERLARHYGIPNVYGNSFRRINLTDPNRYGLLGQGSILTVTSYGYRTSPTLRGKWIMQNLLGAPPPPPPANVPALEATNVPGKTLTVRELMEEHRKNAVCASCHARMDQYGFALENFDAIGRWRTSDTSHVKIDASAVLPDGTKFQGVAGLRNLLLSNKEQFVGALTEKLMTYALGRGVEYYDQPAIREILREAAPGDYRWSALIVGITQSVPFQMRRSQSL